MPLDFTHPHEFSCFGTLHPDHLVAWSFGDPHVEWELTGLFSGPGAYTTIPLDAETDMHYHPGDQGAPNTVAQHLAARYGFDGLDVRGTVHFTGPSGETDRALGIAPDAFDVLYDRVKDICATLGVRTWCKLHPADTVSVRYTDLERGDVYWFPEHPPPIPVLQGFPRRQQDAGVHPGRPHPGLRRRVQGDRLRHLRVPRGPRPRRVLAAHR
ncbi:hypothetical protein ACIGN6_32360 [Streptomyces sp. NPDC053792]|uniref:hypothetical protein n=1 Tax=Streptomyces sp. NPDC053792 TaxID=3365716 RepID=UPI0037D2A4EF